MQFMDEYVKQLKQSLCECSFSLAFIAFIAKA